MIADEREGPIEALVKLLTVPLWGPVYMAILGWRQLKNLRKEDVNVKVEELAPQTWSPASELERRVVAAMVEQDSERRRYLPRGPMAGMRIEEGEVRRPKQFSKITAVGDDGVFRALNERQRFQGTNCSTALLHRKGDDG